MNTRDFCSICISDFVKNKIQCHDCIEMEFNPDGDYLIEKMKKIQTYKNTGNTESEQKKKKAGAKWKDSRV